MNRSKRKGTIKSINFDDNAFEILSSEIDKYRSNYSELVCRLVHTILGADDDVKERLAMLSFQESLKLREEALKEDGFRRGQLLIQGEEFMELSNLFSRDKGVATEAQTNMMRIDMKNAYLICPNDWIVLDFNNPEDSNIAYAIEFKNSEKFHLSHFVCFSKDELDYETMEIALNKAAEIDENFCKVRAMYMDSAFASDGHVLNAKEIEEQPIPGFFPIAVKGKDKSYPYGAMIIPKED